MAESPTLQSKRLELRSFLPELLTPRYVGWLNNKQTMRFSEQRHCDHSIESCRAYAASFNGSPSYFWAVVARDGLLGHIGNVTATVDPNNLSANLAIMIGETEARGKGLGLEAWTSACDFLLREAGMRKVSAGTMATNEPMLRIMRSSGMRQEAVLRGHFLVDGKQVDCVVASRFVGDEH
jgi:RimJ/RimL family protein N-acetyltransferase